METGTQLKVSSDRLVKTGIETGTPGLQGKQFIHHSTAAPIHSWFFDTQCNLSYLIVEQKFKILGQVVTEKSLDENFHNHYI